MNGNKIRNGHTGRYFAMFAVLVIVIMGLSSDIRETTGQELVTSTPVQINLATRPPIAAQTLVGATATWTPAPTPLALLEARDFANVRSEPDTAAAQLGQINAGETYPVIGRYFSWYQFAFPSAPGGTGWVFGELVDIVGGDAAAIPELDLNAVATLPPSILNATATQAVLTLTPGGLLTATAMARLPTVAAPIGVGQPGGILPTFTYPPDIVAIAPSENAPLSSGITPTPAEVTSITLDDAIPSEFPPIAPILLLGVAGIIGLVAASLRR